MLDKSFDIRLSYESMIHVNTSLFWNWIMNNTLRSLEICIQHYQITTITCSSMYHIKANNWQQELFWHNEVDTIKWLKTQKKK